MLLVDWQWWLEGWAPGGGGGGAAAGTKPRHNSASADRSCPAERLSSTHYYLLLLLDHPRLDLETWSLAKIRVPERFGGWSNVGLGLGEVVAATDETFGGAGGGGN